MNRSRARLWAVLLLALAAIMASHLARAGQAMELAGQVELQMEPVRVLAGDPAHPRIALSDGQHALAVVNASGVQWRQHEQGWVTALAFTGQGQLLVATGGDIDGSEPALVVRRADDGRLLARVADVSGAMAVGGDTIVAGGGHGAVRLVHGRDGWSKHIFHPRPVEAVAVSADGTRVALVDMNATGGHAEGESPQRIRLFRLRHGKLTADGVRDGHAHDIAALAFTNSGDLVSADYGGDVWLWPQAGSQGQVIAETYCLHKDVSGQPCQLQASRHAPQLAGSFGNTVLLALPDGTQIDTTAIIARMGPSAVALAGNGFLAWVGRPPTFPVAVVRWWTSHPDGH